MTPACLGTGLKDLVGLGGIREQKGKKVEYIWAHDPRILGLQKNGAFFFSETCEVLILWEQLEAGGKASQRTVYRERILVV